MQTATIAVPTDRQLYPNRRRYDQFRCGLVDRCSEWVHAQLRPDVCDAATAGLRERGHCTRRTSCPRHGDCWRVHETRVRDNGLHTTDVGAAERTATVLRFTLAIPKRWVRMRRILARFAVG